MIQYRNKFQSAISSKIKGKFTLGHKKARTASIPIYLTIGNIKVCYRNLLSINLNIYIYNIFKRISNLNVQFYIFFTLTTSVLLDLII